MLMFFVKQQMVFFIISFVSVIFSIFVSNSFSYKILNGGYIFTLVQYFFSTLIIFSILNLIYCITKKFKFSIIFFLFFYLLLNFINIKKEAYLSSPFTPRDFLLFNETLTSAPALLILSVLIGVFIFTFSLIKVYKYERKQSQHPFILNFLIFIITFPFFIFMNAKENFLPYCEKLDAPSLSCKFALAMPKTRNNWVGDHEIIKSYGFLTFFISKTFDNIYKAKFQKPIPKETISLLYKSKDQKQIDKLPNIVFVMSEAHWDASQLAQSLPQNVTPTINQHQLSTFLSPSFGGGTANAEFEVLTSLNSFLNHNELAYVSNLKRPTYSLPMYLNTLGYETTAMHNNGKYFYNRNKVYQLLDFQRFIALENMVSKNEQPKFINDAGWATDDLLYENIKNQLNKLDKPQFIYAISVENHFNYSDDRFGTDNFNINKLNISESSKQKLNTYFSGMQRADQHLNSLIQFINQTNRPTIVIFFGDHLPSLQEVFDEFHFFKSEQEKTEKKDTRFFETPLSVWANFPIDKKQFEGQFVAAHFLAPKVLEAAHVPLSPYYTFVNKVSSCYKAVHNTGTQPQKSCAFNQADVLKQYQDMNMDVLNGKNFTYQILKPETKS
ncbi:LTA synthase family protein [Acinetobacter wuhouensis]|uniref:LTA synthase family protein n=1 Tax=Acinetobacter wuhouensis TaxID=1879050 RepID=UPI000A835A46|nr:LTA synthase family protein [Acinetobacter wuhouensis]